MRDALLAIRQVTNGKNFELVLADCYARIYSTSSEMLFGQDNLTIKIQPWRVSSPVGTDKKAYDTRFENLQTIA